MRRIYTDVDTADTIYGSGCGDICVGSGVCVRVRRRQGAGVPIDIVCYIALGHCEV